MNPMILLEVLPFSERAKTAGIVTLQGMLTIFLVLSILWASIEILHRCVAKKNKALPKAAEKEDETAPADDAVLVAVITAAISASLESTNPGKKFRVVSFKRAE